MGGRLEGKVALITGAARGQGEAEARLFAAEGARVVLGDIRDDAGAAVAADIGDAAAYVHLDVSSMENWEAAVATCVSRFGGLQVLVNNAAICRYAMIEDSPVEEFLAHMQVNQLGPWLGMKAAVPALKVGGGGSIVNISSTSGLRGVPGSSSYAATKFAVRGMSTCAAIELGPYGVRVNVVCPGGVLTEMARATARGWYGVELEDFGATTEDDNVWQLPLRRLGQPSEVAAAVLFLASDESAYCTGAEIVVDGGLLCDHPVPAGGKHGRQLE